MASGEIRQPAAGRHGKPTLRLVRDRACEDRGTRTAQGSSVSSRNHPGPRLRIAAPAPCEDHGPTLSAPIPAAPRPGSAHEVTGWSDQRLFRPVAGAWGGGVAIAEDATATATFASIWAVPAESDRPMRFGLVIADFASETIHLHRTRCPRFGRDEQTDRPVLARQSACISISQLDQVVSGIHASETSPVLGDRH